MITPPVADEILPASWTEEVTDALNGAHSARLAGASQTVATASWVKVQVGTEDWDGATIADPATYKLTIDTDGYWMIGASLTTAAFSTAHATKVAITNADAAPTSGNTVLKSSYPAAAGEHCHTFSGIRNLTAGTTLYLWYQFDATTSHGINSMSLAAIRIA